MKIERPMPPTPDQTAPATKKSATSKTRVAVLISGGGSNMRALVAASKTDNSATEVVTVIANRPDAPGLAWAEQNGIPTTCIDHTTYASREAFDADIHSALVAKTPDLVACAGFMRRLTPELVQSWRGKMLNIHPSLLPLFKGLNTHQRALDAGVKVAGCSVHLVSEEVDGGQILGQAAVPVMPDDTAEILAARVLRAEHKLYPKVLDLYAAGEITLANDGTVSYGPAALDQFRLSNEFNELIVPAID